MRRAEGVRGGLIEARYGAAMDRALTLAAGAGPDGEALAEAANARQAACDPTAHAEVLALRAAGAALGDSHMDGCELVVTLEPCTMCAGAIQLARPVRSVFAVRERARCAARSACQSPRRGRGRGARAGVRGAAAEILRRAAVRWGRRERPSSRDVHRSGPSLCFFCAMDRGCVCGSVAGGAAACRPGVLVPHRERPRIRCGLGRLLSAV